MEMSNFDIVKSYKEAADKKAQLQVLADLNVCSVEKIRTILIEEGIPCQTLPRNRVKKGATGSIGETAQRVKRAYNRRPKPETPVQPERSDRKNQIIHNALCCYRERMAEEIEKLKARYEVRKKKCEDTIAEIDDLIVSEFPPVDVIEEPNINQKQ